MNAARETIYAALHTLVASTPGIRTASRRLKMWTEVAPADQPAIFTVQRHETSKVTTRMPTIHELYVDIVLYGNNGGQDQSGVAPMSILNPIVDAIEAKLLPSAGAMEQTLGGLVERCRIDGDIQTDEGALGDQAVVIIPVTILVP